MSAPAANPMTRAMHILMTLAGHNLNGLPNSTIAETIGSSDATTLRALERLADAGLVERVPGDEKRWHMTPKLVQIAVAHHAEVAREEQRLSDFSQRYTRTPL